MRKIHLSLWFVLVSFLSLLSFWGWMLLFYRDRPSSAGLYPGLAVLLIFAVLFVVFDLLALVTGAVAARTEQGRAALLMSLFLLIVAVAPWLVFWII